MRILPKPPPELPQNPFQASSRSDLENAECHINVHLSGFSKGLPLLIGHAGAPMRCVYSPGVNLRRFLCTALALYLGEIAAKKADRYGGWRQKPPKLQYSRRHSNNRCRTTARQLQRLGFICDHRDKSGHVGVLPVDGTFENRQRIIPVLVQKKNDQYDPADLLQHWKNGTEYIFLRIEQLTWTSLHLF